MPSTTQLSQIGRLIHDLRDERGLTQAALAKRLRTSQSAVARIERGEQNLTTGMLAKLSKVLEQDIVNVAAGTTSFRVEGGVALSGSIETKTSKNAATALLAASLLNRSTTTLRRVPRIQEVYRIIEVLTSIGVSVRWQDDDLVIEPPKRFSMKSIDEAAAQKTRSIIMLIPPLAHALGSFTLPRAGGCNLGLRSVRPHIRALETLGIHVLKERNRYRIEAKRPKSAYILLAESGDTVTENALMAAARIPGTTTIKYASANYQVQDLCFFLEKLGVRIEGIGTTTLVVEGKKDIDTPVEYFLSEDPTDSMFFLATAAVTRSSLTITRCPIEFLELELLTLRDMGLRYSLSKRYKARNGRTDLVDIMTKPSRLTAPDEKIHPRPYPGLNIDNLPFFAVIATQARGQTLIHDWIYEKRAIYYTELDKLGADTILADPHRIYIEGPTPLTPGELVCPPALRPATILLIAMLAAPGTSTLRNVYTISRGYEDLARRLRSIGAKIELLTEA